MADALAEMAQTVGGMPCTAPVLLTEEEVRSNSPSGDVQNIETSDLHAGRSHVDVEPYPDAQAWKALGMLADPQGADTLTRTESA